MQFLKNYLPASEEQALQKHSKGSLSLAPLRAGLGPLWDRLGWGTRGPMLNERFGFTNRERAFVVKSPAVHQGAGNERKDTVPEI